jgi:hypothetical protein
MVEYEIIRELSAVGTTLNNFRGTLQNIMERYNLRPKGLTDNNFVKY